MCSVNYSFVFNNFLVFPALTIEKNMNANRHRKQGDCNRKLKTVNNGSMGHNLDGCELLIPVVLRKHIASFLFKKDIHSLGTAHFVDVFLS